MMPGSNTKHSIWRGHNPTTRLGSVFYYDRLKISNNTLQFINSNRKRLCRTCKKEFIKEYGICGFRWYCSSKCKIVSRRLIVKKSKNVQHNDRFNLYLQKAP